jgi:type III restriction enzyme
MRLVSVPLTSGERAKYHFDIYNIDYEKEEKSVKAKRDTQVFDYTKNLINLVSQAEQIDRETEYEDLEGIIKPKHTIIQKKVYTVDEVVQKIVDTFKTRDFEAKIRFPKGTYDKENLPPANEIKEIVVKSMNKVGIKSGVLTEDNALRVFQTFQTLFRKRGSTIVFDRKIKTPRRMSTKDLERESLAVGNVRRGATVFYADTFEKEVEAEQKDILKEVIDDESLPRSASKEINHYCLKTPVSVVLTKQEPERKFVETIVNSRVCEKIDAWIKSRDQNFYSIEYSWRKGEHPKNGQFNPDFFIKVGKNIIIIETKADSDVAEDNKGKVEYAKKHVEMLNKIQNEQKYYFWMISPRDYVNFFNKLRNGKLLDFVSTLEIDLEGI